MLKSFINSVLYGIKGMSTSKSYQDWSYKNFFRMRNPDKEILQLVGMDKEQAGLSRYFDFLVVTAAFFLFCGAFHLHLMLSAGDWDMFIDWKDRQFWPLIIPIDTIMFPAAVQAAFWYYFRLPIGATLCGVCLLTSVWIGTYSYWYWWTMFPVTMNVPSIIIAGCILMDITLIVFRRWIFVACIGAPLFALTFYPSNMAALAGYYVPIEHLNSMATAADVIGYTFPRSATPEYIRIIEKGTLRTFEGTSVWVSGVFSAFVCIFLYMLWWQIGMAFSTVKTWSQSPKLKRMLGFREQ